MVMLLGGLIRNRIIIMLIRNFRPYPRRLILIFSSIIFLTRISLGWIVQNVHLHQYTQFDAIISDPPYGLRAMSRSMKKKR